MSLVPYEIDTDDDETCSNLESVPKKTAKRKARVEIVLDSLFAFQDDFRDDAKTSRKSNTAGDLFSILPPPKSEENKFAARDASGELSSKRTRRIYRGFRGDAAGGPATNGRWSDVREPGASRNSQFGELSNARSGTDGRALEVALDRDRVKAITDPEFLDDGPRPEQVNRTCKRMNHISYLVQMAKANEMDFKNKWSASKYTRQQAKAKYGF